MAKKDDLNLGKDGADDEKSGGGSKLIIIIVAVVALAVGGGVAFFLVGGSGGEDTAEAAVEAAPEPAPTVPLYVEMEKVLVNIEFNGRTRYVQSEMQLMSYHQEVVDQATRDMPAIRNRIILLFSAQDFGALRSLEGKEALRAEVLVAVNEVLGLTAPKAVEEVYFESFVLQ